MLPYNNPCMTLGVNMRSYGGSLWNGRLSPQYNMDRSQAEIHVLLNT